MSDRTALYHVYGDDDALLYIGVSKHFGVRWQKHAGIQPWWNEVRWQTVLWYDTRDEALDAEALAIFIEQPQYNVLHRKHALRLRRLNIRTPARPKAPARPRRQAAAPAKPRRAAKPRRSAGATVKPRRAAKPRPAAVPAKPRRAVKPIVEVSLPPGWRAVPPEELSPGVTSMTLGPGVTQETLDYMDAIDELCPDQVVLKPGWLPAGHVLVDYET